MRQEVLEHLENRYNRIASIVKDRCIKYYYIYNKVNVNVYFDSYDKNNILLCLVLAFEKKFYYYSLNTSDYLRKEYLPSIPKSILEQILDEDNTLNDFYSKLEYKILNTNSFDTKYTKDKFFTNTIAYSVKREDLPYLWHLRRANMSDETYKLLIQTTNISHKNLINLKNNGWTIVRTGDIKKRNNLSVIMKEKEIEFKI